MTPYSVKYITTATTTAATAAAATTASTSTSLKPVWSAAIPHVLLGLLVTSIAVFPAASGLHLIDRGGAVTSGRHAPQIPPPTNSTLDFLLRTLEGIEKSLNFFQKEFKIVNLDALIGTRIVQASLKVLLERLARYDVLDTVPSFIVNHIRRLRDTAGDVSDIATPYVVASEPEYFQRIGPIIAENLFALDYDNRDVREDALLWKYNRKEEMNESESDQCLAEVFGTKAGVRCDISTTCWEKMTRLGYNRYSLSHQIFYLEIAEMTGCGKEMQWYILSQQQPSLRTLQDTYCANMLAEANLIADNDFPAKAQDLFMEQAALCGMLGYRQFFTSDWLLRILGWQDPQDGCYRWAGWPEGRDEDNYSDLVQSPSSKRRRVSKREEKRVGRGCLCHRTAVAVSALAQYVRFVLEVWLQEQLS